MKTEWIKVTDRLPEEGKQVLICYKAYDKRYCCLGIYEDGLSEEMEMNVFDTGDGLKVADYWMSIELPEED